MDKQTLYVGAALMIVFGIVFQMEALACVGLGLMWIGLSIWKEQP